MKEDTTQKQNFIYREGFSKLLLKLDQEKGTTYCSMKSFMLYQKTILFHLSKNHPDKVEKAWWVTNKETGELQRKVAFLTPGKALSDFKKGIGDKEPLDTRHVEYLTYLMEQNVITVSKQVTPRKTQLKNQGDQ